MTTYRIQRTILSSLVIPVRNAGGMQKQLLALFELSHTRPQWRCQTNFESSHGLKCRPSVSVENVGDCRSGYSRFLCDSFDASQAGFLSPQIDYRALYQLVLRQLNVQAVGPFWVSAAGASRACFCHTPTVAPGTVIHPLRVVVATLRPQVRLAGDLVRPETRFEHRFGRRDGMDRRPTLAGKPTSQDSLTNASPLGEVLLGTSPAALDVPLDLSHERLTHAECLGVDGRQRLGLDVGPLRVGLARRRIGGHVFHRTGGGREFRSGGRCGGTALVRKGVAPCR